MFMLPLLAFLRRMAELTPFLPPSFLLQKFLFFIGLQLPSPLWNSKGTCDPREEDVFDWVISSDFLSFNESDIPTFIHHFSGSR